MTKPIRLICIHYVGLQCIFSNILSFKCPNINTVSENKEQNSGTEMRWSGHLHCVLLRREALVRPLSYKAAPSQLETIASAPVGASVMNRRRPKSMGLILMTRQDLLNASLQPSLLDAGCNDEMWGRKMEASSATPESYTSRSSSVEWLPSSPSPSPPPLCLHVSPWPWTDRPLNYLHPLIAADCNCRELFRLCWNYSLKGMETDRERERKKKYCWSHKLHVTHVKWRPISKTADVEA